MKLPSFRRPWPVGLFITIGVLLTVGAVFATVLVWYAVQTQLHNAPVTQSTPPPEQP